MSAAPFNPSAGRESRARLVIVLALVSAAGVIAQAALAGTFIAGGHGHALDVHRVLGPLLVVPTLASAVLTRLRLTASVSGARAYRAALVLTVALLAETALGFVSDDHPMVLALHVPVGVGIFGMLATQLHYLRLARVVRPKPRYDAS